MFASKLVRSAGKPLFAKARQSKANSLFAIRSISFLVSVCISPVVSPGTPGILSDGS
jgi:hypothetical protein